MSTLRRILDTKREEVKALRGKRWPTSYEPRPLRLKKPEALSLIAEIKLRSPSAGALSSALSVEARAQVYERCGASMISVLCDAEYFGGSFSDLARARTASTLPLLCKEFVIDESQLDAARACGADAVLLIVRCLDDAALPRLYAAAIDRGLAPLVEVFSPDECARALALDAALIGVNARNLDTLEMFSEQAAEVLGALPASVCRLHLSGIKTPGDVRALVTQGLDGALIGEVLMRTDDPTQLLEGLVAAGRRGADGHPAQK